LINLVKSKDFYVLLGFYLIANILLLLNFDGLYWDDWIVYNQDYTTVKCLLEEIQHGIKGDFFLFLSQYGNGIYPFRLFVFFAIFLIGIFVYLILSTIKEFDKQSLFFITILFLLSPLNSAKISFSITPFLFPVLIFYFAFYLLTVYIKHPNILFRILILALFFVSFSTNSILVFYFSIFLYLYCIEFHFKFDHLLEKAKYFLKRYWDFFALPFLYFIYKAIYLKPYGLYEGYNAVSASTLPKAAVILFKNIDNSFVEVLFESFHTLTSVWIFVTFILYFILKKSHTLIENEQSKSFFIIGAVLFFLAVFPYAMVGKNAELDSWNSRFQILIPLSMSFLLYFGVLLIKKRLPLNSHLTITILWVIVFSFIGKNISDHYKAQIDWFYSISIRENVKENLLIQNNSTFIVNNNLKANSLYNRDLIYYELNGILKSAFKDDSRLAIRYDHYFNDLKGIEKNKHHKQYNFSNWTPSTPLLVTLSYNYKAHVNQDMYIRMMIYQYTNQKKFLKMAKNLVAISVEPLPLGENNE
jgi:hypothetical protein